MSAEASWESVMQAEDQPALSLVGTYADLHAQVERREDGRSTGIDAEYLCCHYMVARGDFKWALKWDDLDFPGLYRWQQTEFGIDVIAEHVDGSIWAVQVKDYQKYVGYAAFTNMNAFVQSGLRRGCKIDRLSVFCADAPASKNLIEKCEEEDTVIFDRFDFNRHGWPTTMADLKRQYEERLSRMNKALVRQRISAPVHQPIGKLWKHQKAALAKVRKHFREGGDKGRVYMVTGAGKTITFVRLAKDHNTVLILVPRLLLAQQTYEKLIQNLPVGHFPNILFVASKDVTKGYDDLDPSQLPATTTTKVDEIAAFMQQSGRKLIISTYHSSARLADAKADIDLAIFDEAHHAAHFTRKNDKPKYAQALLGYEGIGKRVFFTATPRIYSAEIRNGGKRKGHYVASMDDEAKFGPLLYEFPYSKALASGDNIVKPYEIHVVGLTTEEYRDALTERSIKDKKTKRNVNSLHILAAMAMAEVVRKHRLTKGIGFLNSVDNAKRLRDYYHEYVGDDFAEALSHEKTVNANKRALVKFVEEPKSFITNVNILSEGMDAPCVDYVVFADPMKSQHAIAQKIGRGLRFDPQNPSAKLIIVVPVLLNDENQLEPGVFKTVMEVLGAMATMDSTLEVEIKKIANNLVGNGWESRIKIDADIPVVDLERLRKTIITAVYSDASAKWWMRFAELRRYLDTSGGDYPPYGTFLATWLNAQRATYAGTQPNSRLFDDQITALAGLPGFDWTPSAKYQRIRVGERFGPYTVVKLSGPKATVRCEHGVTKTIERQTVPRVKDCGCGRSIPAGTEFGLVKVVEDRGFNNVLVRCKCGNEKTVRRQSLRVGDCQSCGCQGSKLTAGDPYGRFTVIEDRGYNDVLVRCECGREKSVTRGKLRNGHARGCGCKKRRLSNVQVRAIRKRVANGEGQRAVGVDYGITQTAVGHIVRRKSYKDVK